MSVNVTPYEAEKPTWIYRCTDWYVCPSCGRDSQFPTQYCSYCGEQLALPTVKTNEENDGDTEVADA